jgi:hypothetical protein
MEAAMFIHMCSAERPDIETAIAVSPLMNDIRCRLLRRGAALPRWPGGAVSVEFRPLTVERGRVAVGARKRAAAERGRDAVGCNHREVSFAVVGQRRMERIYGREVNGHAAWSEQAPGRSHG